MSPSLEPPAADARLELEEITALAKRFIDAKRFDEAIQLYEMALRFDPNPRAGPTFNVAMAFYQAKRHADAVQLLEHGVLRIPSYPFFNALLAASYGQMGRLAEAAQELDKFRRRNPFFDPSTTGSRFRNPEHQAYFIEGLVKAGLK